MTQGRFLTIEGVEGVGKSTNLKFIESWLEGKGIQYVSTREPGGTESGERIRSLLLDRRADLSAMTELLLMFAARNQHVEEVIKPALNQGHWVVSDRFTDSSYAYQGGGRGLAEETIRSIEQLTLGAFRPDATLILDLPVEQGLERAAMVGEKDRFEMESKEFFVRVRQVFLERARSSDRYLIVDASQSLEVVQAHIRRWLESLLRE